MRCYAILLAVMLALVGCGSEIQGTAEPPASHCVFNGFEDLPADSADCGKTIEGVILGAGYTARAVDLGGREVLYLISDQLMDNTVALPSTTEDETVVRGYAHAAVQAVQRMTNVDIVQIVVSDDCPVEELYGNIDAQLDCHSTGPLLGWQLSSEGAATILSSAMVAQLEATATAANQRLVYYELETVQSN